MDAVTIADLSIFIGGPLLAVFYLGVVRAGDHLRGSSVVIPALGFIFAVCNIMLGGSWLTLTIVGGILVSGEILYFVGPYQVSGWAWPNRDKWKTPTRVKLIVVAVGFGATLLFSTAIVFYTFFAIQYFNAYTGAYPIPSSFPLHYPFYYYYMDGFMLTTGGMAGLIFRFPPLWGLSCLFAWGAYTILVGCFTHDSQEKSGVLQSCWIDGNNHLVRFASDTNAYHVSSSLYKTLARRGRGAQYSYTLVTSFNGRQFIRKPPVLISWTSTNTRSGYATISEESAATGSFDSGGTPVVRVLGGDGSVGMDVSTLVGGKRS